MPTNGDANQPLHSVCSVCAAAIDGIDSAATTITNTTIRRMMNSCIEVVLSAWGLVLGPSLVLSPLSLIRPGTKDHGPWTQDGPGTKHQGPRTRVYCPLVELPRTGTM